MNKGLFITSTDTGVGKTLVSCGIARWLVQQKMAPGVFKPVATGDQDDAIRLKAAARAPEDLTVINPQFFKAPVAPSVAAALESREVELDKIYQAFWQLSKAHPAMVVEGVGGVKVPLAESTFVHDLISALRLPTLVVARPGLGTINHTLLTLSALEAAKIEVIGVVFTGSRGKTLVEKTNPDELQEHTSALVLESLPYNARFEKDPDATAAAIAKMPRLVRALKRVCGVS